MSDSFDDDAFATFFGDVGLKAIESLKNTKPASPSSRQLAKGAPPPQSSPEANKSDSEPESPQEEESQIDEDKLVGQRAAKGALNQIVSLTEVNLERGRRGIAVQKVTLHGVFSGSPGTGKTTFARLYAQKIKSLGVLSKGHLVEVSREDLVASYQGQTAKKTMDVIRKAAGGVLFIDEAYSLKSSKDDHFGQEAVDALVKGMEDLRDDLIVILAGYTNEMNAFLHLNPGLKSRLPHHIIFEDFSVDELMSIFDGMLERSQLTIDEDARDHLRERVQMAKKGRSFGNARVVRNLFEQALTQQGTRLAKGNLSELSTDALNRLIYSDTTESTYDHGTKSEVTGQDPIQEKSTALEELLGLVGISRIKDEVKRLYDFVQVSRLRRPDNPFQDLTFHMVFSGNPGTGKTTVARLMGCIFKESGLLASGHLVEADRSSLVAEYSGQTAVKTKELIQSALGGVLFIDEAYTLFRGDGGDQFGREAIDTLLKYMEDHRGNLVVILAGYPQEMKLFMGANPGLKSRFSKVLKFDDFTPEEAMTIAKSMAKEQGFELADEAQAQLRNQYIKMQGQANFANARMIRLALEEAYRRQAGRIMKEDHPDQASAEQLATLTEDDFN